MNTFKFLITYTDGDVREVTTTGRTQQSALADLTGSLSNAIASIDFIKEGETPALVKARKSKRRPSRADRFGEAQSDVSSAKGNAEELRDELQNWLDNLPENLQSGSKASELEDAISSLEEFINSCEEAEGVDVQFPGMY